MGGRKWMKPKLGLGLRLNSCLQLPGMIEDSTSRLSAALLSPPVTGNSEGLVKMPATPTPSSSGIHSGRVSSNSKSCERICSICLATMNPGSGHAIFTAECSHSFHFRCIASNVKHGRQTCPVCRAKWNDIPFHRPSPAITTKVRASSCPQNDELFLHLRRPETRHATDLYDDDDELASDETSTASGLCCDGRVAIETYPEVCAVPKMKSHKNFQVLVHLKAPPAMASAVREAGSSSSGVSSRAPIDLVTVLDVSGSMSGSKLALLKRAMGFVIQNLGPSDRLSVVAFSSTARRLFPLRRMTETGRLLALQAVNSLCSNGGTNIVEGLRKGVKVMTDRKWKHSVSSIILLSDGQDSYNTISDFKSMHRDRPSGIRIPVHAFGFGADHDAVSMHSISEATGGTFSFIETETVMQDAFAQCLGGLLSVVVQDLKLEVQCIHPQLRLASIKSGSYKTTVESDSRKASIEIGDMYAEEGRDFLIATDVPVEESAEEMMSLLKIRCSYKNPISKSSMLQDDSADDVRIQRPSALSEPAAVSLVVDKQRNRIQSAEAIAEAKAAAERGDLASATTILESCRSHLSETVSARAGDSLTLALIDELREVQQRMVSRRVYETSGRAYVLSGLSSHSWQRTTARGNSTGDGTGLVPLYRTPAMADMVNLSQTMTFDGPGNWHPRSSLAAHHRR